MKLKLRKHGVRADQVILGALSKLALDPEKKHKDEVHNTRVTLKRLKALLRLLEDVGVRGAKTQRRALQAEGRRLGPFREAQILAKYRPELEAEGKVLTDDIHLKGVPADAVASATQASKSSIRLEEAIRRSRLDEDAVAEGLAKTVKRCRKAYERCVDDPDMENFHDLRKRTKDLQYQLELMEPLLKKFPNKLKESLRDLTSRLGEAHDWADISHHLKGPKPAVRRALKLSEKALHLAKPLLGKSQAIEVH